MRSLVCLPLWGLMCFCVCGQGVTVSSISGGGFPTALVPGSILTVTGTGFSTTAADNVLEFWDAGTSMVVTSQAACDATASQLGCANPTSTQFTVPVPVNAPKTQVSLRVKVGSKTPVPYSVMVSRQVHSFVGFYRNRTEAAKGSEIAIEVLHAAHLPAWNLVYFAGIGNDSPASPISIDYDVTETVDTDRGSTVDRIYVIVPNNAQTGAVRVVIGGETVSSGSFTLHDCPLSGALGNDNFVPGGTVKFTFASGSTPYGTANDYLAFFVPHETSSLSSGFDGDTEGTLETKYLTSSALVAASGDDPATLSFTFPSGASYFGAATLHIAATPLAGDVYKGLSASTVCRVKAHTDPDETIGGLKGETRRSIVLDKTLSFSHFAPNASSIYIDSKQTDFAHAKAGEVLYYWGTGFSHQDKVTFKVKGANSGDPPTTKDVQVFFPTQKAINDEDSFALDAVKGYFGQVEIPENALTGTLTVTHGSLSGRTVTTPELGIVPLKIN